MTTTEFWDISSPIAFTVDKEKHTEKSSRYHNMHQRRFTCLTELSLVPIEDPLNVTLSN